MTVRIFDDEPAPGFITTLCVENGTVKSVHVEAKPGNKVTGSDMRKLRVHDLMSQATSPLPPQVNEEDLQRVRELRRRAKDWSEIVRLLHAYAIDTGRHPVKYVRDQLDLAPATATRWVRAAV